MFSKSLFRQSCKANGVMWGIITFAVCFMLACVMLIAGNGNISKTKMAVQDSIIMGELESSVQDRAINGYEVANGALAHFDGVYLSELGKQTASEEYLLMKGAYGEEQANQYAALVAYRNAAEELQTYVSELSRSLGYEPESDEELELMGTVFYVLNVMNQDEKGNLVYQFDDFYTALGEEPPRYDLSGVASEGRAEWREKYAMNNSTVFLSGNLVTEESIARILGALADYGVTREKYASFGYDDYAQVKSVARAAVVNYRGNLEYRLDNLRADETPEGVREDVRKKITGSLLSTLPQEVSDALEEIGSMDLYGVLVGSIFFRMAGLLLPIIYMIMTSNALIAGQVDSGSMAYILSTSTKRRAVTFTQASYLISSIFVMFVLTTITSLVCFSLVDVETGLNVGKLLLINFGAFLVMFAMSGICFLASCYFNRSKHSMALGGGLNMFFLVATMLGLFGSSVLPSIFRMTALDAFNYVTIISLFDVVSILENAPAVYLPKLAALVLIGTVCYFAGGFVFRKKDLPL